MGFLQLLGLLIHKRSRKKGKQRTFNGLLPFTGLSIFKYGIPRVANTVRRQQITTNPLISKKITIHKFPVKKLAKSIVPKEAVAAVTLLLLPTLLPDQCKEVQSAGNYTLTIAQ